MQTEKYEKSINIPIKHTILKKFSPATEYSLNQNLFDPSKSSPPNEFMLKLCRRVGRYYDMKVDNLDKE